mmetsp:Transcript_31764/g.28132  ORF Transcript_31764/g.28132 Transcript_31764/m.28132 type:complete len:106 (-) Transcript_31764:3-320(-)
METVKEYQGKVNDRKKEIFKIQKESSNRSIGEKVNSRNRINSSMRGINKSMNISIGHRRRENSTVKQRLKDKKKHSVDKIGLVNFIMKKHEKKLKKIESKNQFFS